MSKIICVKRKGCHAYFNQLKDEIIANALKTINTSSDIHCGDVFRHEGKIYSICSEHPKDDLLIASEIEKIHDEPDETYSEHEITCPYCGHEHGDSWEESHDDGERDCGECGSKFSWQRDVAVSYSSQPLEKCQIIEI